MDLSNIRHDIDRARELALEDSFSRGAGQVRCESICISVDHGMEQGFIEDIFVIQFSAHLTKPCLCHCRH